MRKSNGTDLCRDKDRLAGEYQRMEAFKLLLNIFLLVLFFVVNRRNVCTPVIKLQSDCQVVVPVSVTTVTAATYKLNSNDPKL